MLKDIEKTNAQKKALEMGEIKEKMPGYEKVNKLEKQEGMEGQVR